MSTNAAVTTISVEIKRVLTGHFANQVIEVEQASSKSTYIYARLILSSVHEGKDSFTNQNGKAEFDVSCECLSSE